MGHQENLQAFKLQEVEELLVIGVELFSCHDHNDSLLQ